MDKLKKYVDEKFDYYSEFSCSEVEHCTLDEFDSDVIEYLTLNERFDYRGICIYLVEEENEIWIENMDA
jgi:hypothetical protein